MINLMHGDCLEMMKTIPGNSIDLVLCDPPYGIDFQSMRCASPRFEKIANDCTPFIEPLKLIKPLLRNGGGGNAVYKVDRAG